MSEAARGAANIAEARAYWLDLRQRASIACAANPLMWLAVHGVPLCHRCAVPVGADRDHCPTHSAVQPDLFGAAGAAP